MTPAAALRRKRRELFAYGMCLLAPLTFGKNGCRVFPLTDIPRRDRRATDLGTKPVASVSGRRAQRSYETAPQRAPLVGRCSESRRTDLTVGIAVGLAPTYHADSFRIRRAPLKTSNEIAAPTIKSG